MRFVTRLALSLLVLVGAAAPAWAQSRAEIESAMKRATSFMVEKVATNGGYVWAYLPDKSRRWGEIEAYPSMVWVQPPGTATMGHLFLDAFHATGDPILLPRGRAGGRSLDPRPASKRRLELFHRLRRPRLDPPLVRDDRPECLADGGIPASFATMRRSTMPGRRRRCSSCSASMLEKRDPKYRAPLDKAIRFVLDSQYPNGGWPQRWPADPGFPAYASHITFNDDVAAENIRFLLMVRQVLGERRVLDPIRRAMNVFLVTQQPAPQAGWALQHDFRRSSPPPREAMSRSLWRPTPRPPTCAS